MTGPEVRFDVLGMDPIPQGSKSVTKTGRMYEANKHLPAWRKMLVTEFEKVAGEGWDAWDGALECVAVFWIPKPRTTKFTQPISKPDTDKLQRAVGDALKIAGIISDDSRILHWNARKAWAQDLPGATIILRQTEE